MKTSVGVAFGVVAALGASFAVMSNNAPDRPPGVAADHWAAISDTLGVVLVPDSELVGLPALPVGASGGSPMSPISPRADRTEPVGASLMDRTGLYAEPTAAVRAIIEEGNPVRGYIMVKRGRVWRPLTVVPPTIDN